MNTSSRASTRSKAKTPSATAAKKRRTGDAALTRKAKKKHDTNAAIATDLAPAVAIALLDKTEQEPGAPAPALDCLAAGVTASEDDGKVRVQLMFENGAVLPVEMSVHAGIALSNGLADELPKPK